MRKAAVVSGVVIVALAAGGTVLVQHRVASARAKDRREALAVGQRFLSDWGARRYDDMSALTAGGDLPGAVYSKLDGRLKTSRLSVVPGALAADGKHLPFTVSAQLSGLGQLDWTTQLELGKTGGRWLVRFHSDAVYPGLRNGQTLTRSQPLISHGDLLDRSGTAIRPADADLAANVLGKVGSSGLERIYAAQLTGSSGGDVQIKDQGTGASTLVKHFPPTVARSVTTTLDLGLQKAGEAALGGVPGRAALVALDAATGEVRAIVNSPVVGLPPAYSMQAPGSTFKVVVAAAALVHGATLNTPLACPATVTFGGKSFRNDEPLPARLTLQQAFAKSCNTAFLNLANTLPKGTLRLTAPLFGFDRGALLPGGGGGTIPEPAGTTEAYADVIGQGRVEASPLLLASMAAAVASGTWRQPHLVKGDAPNSPLPANIVGPLRAMMASVVTSGTAAGAGLPAGTAGKTGTAQFGTASPLATHAWFAGFAKGLAFCVYAERGASGGTVAAPAAARFLRAAPG